MHRWGARILGLGLPLMLLAGCTREEPRSSSIPQARAPAPQAIPETIAPSSAATPAAYVASASSIELFEIMSSELALQRARTKRVREFAEMVLNTHKGASMQLSLAGRSLTGSDLQAHRAWNRQFPACGPFSPMASPRTVRHNESDDVGHCRANRS